MGRLVDSELGSQALPGQTECPAAPSQPGGPRLSRVEGRIPQEADYPRKLTDFWLSSVDPQLVTDTAEQQIHWTSTRRSVRRGGNRSGDQGGANPRFALIRSRNRASGLPSPFSHRVTVDSSMPSSAASLFRDSPGA
jgi:hypothetical protein